MWDTHICWVTRSRVFSGVLDTEYEISTRYFVSNNKIFISFECIRAVQSCAPVRIYIYTKEEAMYDL